MADTIKIINDTMRTNLLAKPTIQNNILHEDSRRGYVSHEDPLVTFLNELKLEKLNSELEKLDIYDFESVKILGVLSDSNMKYIRRQLNDAEMIKYEKFAIFVEVSRLEGLPENPPFNAQDIKSLVEMEELVITVLNELLADDNISKGLYDRLIISKESHQRCLRSCFHLYSNEELYLQRFQDSSSIILPQNCYRQNLNAEKMIQTKPQKMLSFDDNAKIGSCDPFIEPSIILLTTSSFSLKPPESKKCYLCRDSFFASFEKHHKRCLNSAKRLEQILCKKILKVYGDAHYFILLNGNYLLAEETDTDDNIYFFSEWNSYQSELQCFLRYYPRDKIWKLEGFQAGSLFLNFTFPASRKFGSDCTILWTGETVLGNFRSRDMQQDSCVRLPCTIK